MRFVNYAIKVFVSITFLLLLLGVSMLFYGFSEIAFAPYFSVADSDVASIVTSAPPVEPSAPGSPDVTVLPEVTEQPIVSEPPASLPPPTDPEIEGYFRVNMEPIDIQRGSLILIDAENRYEILEENDLIPIADYKTSSYRVASNDLLLSKSIIDPLNKMMDDFHAKTGNENTAIVSAFRGYDRQQEILNEYVSLVGRAEATRWAALPGHSEHHTGLAVDLGVYSAGSYRTFMGKDTYEWIYKNAHLYGFILRYPQEKTEITKTIYEPWHYRYVGEPHAYIIYKNDLCLEEYMELIKEHTHDDPYIAAIGDDEYEIYFTRDSKLLLPDGCEYNISGNNIDGFIVTLQYPTS